ncbi:MAG: putative extracellular enzyme of alpha/beta hydrolase superfamily [Labilithrix sp.]|nr:putative extracellular enzyme of alpha/beta hydrolase superfamily [Labilithrix sp.]
MRKSAVGQLVLTFAALASGCGDSDAGVPLAPAGSAQSIFVVPAAPDALSGLAFFDHPFPSDLRRDAKGAAVFTGFPNPQNLPLLTQYVNATAGLLDGFSPAAAIALRFDGPIDETTLPQTPDAAARSDASVQIVDVDPASPERGQRHLAQLHWQEAEAVYWPSNTLAVLPMLGRPLRPRTRYAVVVTSKVHARSGAGITVAPELAQVLDRDPLTEPVRPVHDLFAPAVAELAAAGIAKSDIVHLTVFTTDDPTAEAFAAMDDVRASVAAPTPSGFVKKEMTGDYAVVEGTYGPSPNYQQGVVPYRKPEDGGGFVSIDGKPQLQGLFELRFALAVPDPVKCPLPAAGFPIVLYSHGTGGDYRSFLDDGTGRALATQCLATMGIDQIFHGTRPGAPALGDPNAESIIQLLFFNLDNILAARSSNRQSAIDVVQQARLFTEGAMKVPAAVLGAPSDIVFDPTKVLFFGHSQGGLNGPLFLAGSDQARGAVLSGAGSDLALNLLEKTKPVDVAAAFRLLVGLSDRTTATELSLFHPVMTLVQSLVDAADPLEYGSAIVRAPRPGHSPKSIYQTEGVGADGLGDSYAPPHGIEALSVAIGLPRQLPGVHPVTEAAFAGITDVSVPGDGLSGNLASGAASGVLAQFVPARGHDGHFVVFDDAKARLQAATFLANLAADSKGRVPALR